MTEAAPVFTKGRDLAATADALGTWLAAHFGDDSIEVDGLEYPSGAGLSNETILFEARSRATGTIHELVLRPEPAPEYQLFLDPNLRTQYDLLRVLGRLGTVRVPSTFWYEADPNVLGRPFFLMQRLRGRVPVSMPVYNGTGWLVDASPEQRRTAWLSAVNQLAAIHAVPVDEVRFLDTPERGNTSTAQQLSYWTELAAVAHGNAIPDVVESLFEWLRANEPKDEAPGLSWGDARIGNMMFDDDFKVVGVLDWEQATLSGAMCDLGWWLYFDEMHSTGSDLARLDGLGTRRETIELWQELTGRCVGDVRWHEVFAGLKVGLLAERTRSVLDRMGLKLSGSGPDRFLRPSCRLATLPEPR
jgi:aminoglycoside phosphotransferase (APT) family kinase protein